MMSAVLNELLSPDALISFQKFLGATEDEQRRRMREITRAFEEDSSSDPGARADGPTKYDIVEVIAAALTGPEPDIEAWLTAIASGNFELRPDTLYARANGKGSPSRVLRRQREMLERQAERMADDVDAEPLDLAAQVQSARLLVASMLTRALRDTCGARAAVGVAWPIMIAAHDHLSDKQLSVLRHFGGDIDFQRILSDGVATAIKLWIEGWRSGYWPAISTTSYRRGLPPGVDAAAAVEYLTKEDRAVDAYRQGLFEAFGHESAPDPISGRSSLKEIVAWDCSILQGTTASAPHRKRYRYFTEANDHSVALTEADYQRIRGLLPVLNARSVHGVHPLDAWSRLAFNAERRAALRQDPTVPIPDRELQDEISQYVREGGAPPRGLTAAHAFYFEEEVCRLPEDAPASDDWTPFNLHHPPLLI